MSVTHSRSAGVAGVTTPAPKKLSRRHRRRHEAPVSDEDASDADRSAPVWLQLVIAWHQANRYVAPIVLDAEIGSLAAVIATGDTGMAAGMGIGLICCGLFFGVWKRRTSLESQGVAWYVRHLIPAAVGAAFVTRLFVHGTTDRDALGAALTVVVALTVVRVLLWQVISSARRRGLGLHPALVIGPPHHIEQIQHRMGTFPEAGLRFVAGHEADPQEGVTPESGRALVAELLSKHPVDNVVFVADEVGEDAFKDFVRFAPPGVQVSVVLPLARLGVHARASLGELGVIPVYLQPSWGSSAAKRAFDLVVSVFGLMLVSPILAVTAIAIRLDSTGPAIFKQPRVGRNGRVFTVYKFRSMVDNAEAVSSGHVAYEGARKEDGSGPATIAELIRNAPIDDLSHLFNLLREQDPRVTKVGAFIRKTAIDELPQLFNVIKGDMSLVGPRPLPVSPEQFDTGAQIRHRVLPGMTGPWQTYGSSALPYRDMIELDLSYVANHSLGVDLLLIARTVPALLNRRAPA